MLSLSRRGLGAAILSLPAIRTARAQAAFPDRPITIVVPYAPGGGTDLVGRAVAQRMEQNLGQPVVIENRAGAATAIGSTYVAQARPDGYTLLFGASSLAINPALQPNLTPRDPQAELAAIGPVYSNPLVLVVGSKVPATTLGEFIALAKANSNSMNYGSAGIGAVNHLMFEMLKGKAGISIEHVPYRGGTAALLDIQGGRLDATFASPLEAQSLLSERAVKALGVSSAERLPLLNDVPPIGATLANFDASFWMGLFAPARTPEPVMARLNMALRAVTGNVELRKRMAAQGVELREGSPADMRALLAHDTAAWRQVIEEGQIKAD